MVLNYKIEGEGEPLLLLHGLGITFTIWQDLVPLLKPHYKLIMVELPGHGKSPLPNFHLPYYQESACRLEELRQSLGIERWNILGYSMGAWAAHEYIRRYPEHVSHAIFLCPATLNRFWSWSLEGLVKVDRYLPSLASWLLDGWRLNRLVRALGFNGRRHPYAAYWTKEIHGQPVQVIKQLLRDLPNSGRARFSLPEGVHSVFIWGAKDVIVSRPKRRRPNDVFVPAMHSAPQLAASAIASAVMAYEAPVEPANLGESQAAFDALLWGL